MGQPRAKTGVNLRPNRANIGQQQQQDKNNDDHDNNNNTNNNNNESPWHCRRPSVVTEGYIRWPPLPPTTSYLPRTYLRPTIIVVIYSVFCVWCSKKIVFYRVLWPSPSPGFILATLKNHGFFMVLGLRKGSGTENWPS